MRKLIYAFVIFVGLVVITLVALPMLVSTDTVRDTVIAAMKTKTGRTLSINGDVSFSALPSVHVTAKKVALSNPPGFAQTPFATMDRLEIKLGLMALLTGNLAVEGFVLINPKINLAIDKSGRTNWAFGQTGKAPPASNGQAGFGAVPIGIFEIENGQVIYTNAQKDTKHEFSNINLNVVMPSPSDTLKLAGNMLWNGEEVRLSTQLATPAALNNGRPTILAVKIDSKSLAAELAGNLTKQKDTYSLTSARLRLNEDTANGNVAIKLGQPRTLVTAALKMNTLNLNKYQGNDSTKKSKKSAGWSRNEIDFSGLKAVDGDFKLAVSSIHYGKVKTGAATLTAKLRDGVLTANLPKLALYDGEVKLALSIDGRKPTPTLKSIGEIKNVNALPFLRDAIEYSKIEGRTNLTFNLTSTGTSQHAIMAGLNGTARLNFQNGALLGINIGRILRAVRRGQTQGFAKGGKTPFGNIVANYQFRKGVGRNRNLKMSGGEVTITGNGSVTMPNQTLAYRVNPALVGKGGIVVLGINVPIIVTGPWAKPKIYPELPGILDTPAVALKGLTTIGTDGVKGVTGVIQKIVPIGPGSEQNPIGKAFKKPFKKLF